MIEVLCKNHVDAKPRDARPNRETTDAETSGKYPLQLIADLEAPALQLAGRKAACLLHCPQYRAFCVRRRRRHGPEQSQRPTDVAQLRLARLRQPHRELASIRNSRRAEAAGVDPAEQHGLLSIPGDRRKNKATRR